MATALRATATTCARLTAARAAAFAVGVRCSSSSYPFARQLDASSIKGRHLDDLFSFTGAEIDALLAMAHALKHSMGTLKQVYQPLKGRSMSMLFQKRSTRTRVSTESGFAALGGHALFLGSEDIQLGKGGESLRDTARVLSRFNDLLLARVFAHADIEELCAHATVPVINALSDAQHPLQGLADLMALQQRFGSVRGLTVAWVGDGNNIAHTLMSVAGRMGFHLRVATPRGYEPDARITARAAALAAHAGVQLWTGTNPLEAVAGADVIATDTWVSMGQEVEAAQRRAAFAGYQVTEAMAREGGAARDWAFLHCLPRKPQEVDDEVFYGPRSLVWDEAENRKWTVMAVALAQLQGGADL